MNGTKRTIRHNGIDREYWAVVPTGAGAAKLPTALVFHGGRGNAAAIQRCSQLDQAAAQRGLVTIYPEGMPTPFGDDQRVWNAGTCCGDADDVGFVYYVIENAITHFPVDRDKLFATGFSLGAGFAHRLATAMPTIIKAVAPVSTGLLLDVKPDVQMPVPILHFHGAEDGHALINGGQVGAVKHDPIRQTIDWWAKANGCNPVPAVETKPDYRRETYSGGKAPVIYYLLPEGGHQWPGGRDNGIPGETLVRTVDASKLMLDFFLAV